MLNPVSIHPAALWAQNTELTPIEIDCVTTIMLKILDGKCKMLPREKEVMSLVYDVVKHRTGNFFGAEVHNLIRLARLRNDHEMKEIIYEQRLYAETRISRPVMKNFKAMLYENHIIGYPQ